MKWAALLLAVSLGCAQAGDAAAMALQSGEAGTVSTSWESAAAETSEDSRQENPSDRMAEAPEETDEDVLSESTAIQESAESSESGLSEETDDPERSGAESSAEPYLPSEETDDPEGSGAKSTTGETSEEASEDDGIQDVTAEDDTEGETAAEETEIPLLMGEQSVTACRAALLASSGTGRDDYFTLVSSPVTVKAWANAHSLTYHNSVDYAIPANYTRSLFSTHHIKAYRFGSAPRMEYVLGGNASESYLNNNWAPTLICNSTSVANAESNGQYIDLYGAGYVDGEQVDVRIIPYVKTGNACGISVATFSGASDSHYALKNWTQRGRATGRNDIRVVIYSKGVYNAYRVKMNTDAMENIPEDRDQEGVLVNVNYSFDQGYTNNTLIHVGVKFYKLGTLVTASGGAGTTASQIKKTIRGATTIKDLDGRPAASSGGRVRFDEGFLPTAKQGSIDGLYVEESSTVLKVNGSTSDTDPPAYIVNTSGSETSDGNKNTQVKVLWSTTSAGLFVYDYFAGVVRGHTVDDDPAEMRYYLSASYPAITGMSVSTKKASLSGKTIPASMEEPEADLFVLHARTRDLSSVWTAKKTAVSNSLSGWTVKGWTYNESDASSVTYPGESTAVTFSGDANMPFIRRLAATAELSTGYLKITKQQSTALSKARTITFTVTGSNLPTNVTYSRSLTLTVPAGQTRASVTLQVPVGTYTIKETVPGGWESGYVSSGNSMTTTVSSSHTSSAPREAVFVNTILRGTLKITKTISRVQAEAVSFRFRISEGTGISGTRIITGAWDSEADLSGILGEHTLTIPAGQLSASYTLTDVPIGWYTVTEEEKEGWNLTRAHSISSQGTAAETTADVRLIRNALSEYFFENEQPLAHVRVTKRILASEVYFPHGNPAFFFVLSGAEEENSGYVYRGMVTFTEENLQSATGEDGYASLTWEFPDLPAGRYVLSEEQTLRYRLESVSAVTSNGTVEGDSVRFVLEGGQTGEAVFTNRKADWNDYSASTSVINHINP